MSLPDEVKNLLIKNGAMTYWDIATKLNRSPYGVRNVCEDLVWRMGELVRIGKDYQRGTRYAAAVPYGKGVCVSL